MLFQHEKHSIFIMKFKCYMILQGSEVCRNVFPVRAISCVPLHVAHRALSFAKHILYWYKMLFQHEKHSIFLMKFKCYMILQGSEVWRNVFPVRMISCVPLHVAHRALSFAYRSYTIFFWEKYKHYYIHNTISSLYKEAWVSMQKCLSHTNDLVCSAARCAPCAVVCVRVHVFMFL